MPRLKPAKGFRHDAANGTVRETKTKAFSGERGRSRQREHSLGASHGFRRFREKASTHLSELSTTGRSGKQLHAQIALQIDDRLAQRRLCNVQTLGRAAVMQLISKRYEVAEVVQFQVSCLSLDEKP